MADAHRSNPDRMAIIVYKMNVKGRSIGQKKPGSVASQGQPGTMKQI